MCFIMRSLPTDSEEQPAAQGGALIVWVDWYFETGRGEVSTPRFDSSR